MRQVGFIGLCVCAWFGVSSPAFAAPDDQENIVKDFLKPSVVKLNVVFENRILEGGSDICKSEGTGFIVDNKYVLTATHVFSFNPACGKAEIFSTSSYEETERHLTLVASAEDAALLMVDGEQFDLNQDTGVVRPCALRVSPKNFYQVNAIRYGIAGGRKYPQPFAAEIGPEINDFKPKLQIFPIPVIYGESGGPVVYAGKVVGMIRETITSQPIVSLITPSEFFAPLLEAKKIKAEAGELCNYVAYSSLVSLKVDRLGTNLVQVTVKVDESAEKYPAFKTDLTAYLSEQVNKIARENNLVRVKEGRDPASIEEAFTFEAPKARFCTIKNICTTVPLSASIDRFVFGARAFKSGLPGVIDDRSAQYFQ